MTLVSFASSSSTILQGTFATSPEYDGWLRDSSEVTPAQIAAEDVEWDAVAEKHAGKLDTLLATFRQRIANGESTDMNLTDF